MRFGLFYEHQLPRPWEEDDEERLLLDALEQIELADRVGIDNVWEVEHHFLEEYSHSSAPEVFLAAASQRTKNIRLGHGIVQMPVAFNHPARIAERIATLDLVSSGRVEFGTGEASSQAELGGFGVPRGAKREQWAEAVDVVCRMLSETPFTGHHGPWIDAPPRNVVPKPKQRPHPPLWVACSRRETIELAARTGMGALSFSFVEPEDAKPWVESYYQILASPECVPAGFAVNPNLAVVVPFMCHSDEETAIERGIDGAHFFGYSLAHYYAFGRHRPGYTNVWEEFDRHRHERGFAREAVRADQQSLDVKIVQGAVGSLRGAVGTPDQVAELLARYEAAGVDQVIFVAQAGRNRHDHICEAIELFGQEVLPRFGEDREEREAAKREHLAPAVEQALARRQHPPALDTERYVVAATGELTPARTPRIHRAPVLKTLTPRKLTERAIQQGLAVILSMVPDGIVRRVAASAPAVGVYQRGMEAALRGGDIGGIKASVRVELTDGDDVHAWTVSVANGKVRSSRNGDAADATLRMRVDDWLGIIAGTANPGELLFDGKLHIHGDDMKALALFSALDPEHSLF